MKPLKNIGPAKGTIVAPGLLAIIDHLRAHPGSALEDLQAQFAGMAALNGKGVGRWLGNRLTDLQLRGVVERRRDDADGVMKFYLAPDAPAAPAPTTEVAPGPGVAQPYRLSIYDGGSYVPQRTTPRAGSLDFTRCPSILLGQPRTYRSGL